jgi:hypothetical protein
MTGSAPWRGRRGARSSRIARTTPTSAATSAARMARVRMRRIRRAYPPHALTFGAPDGRIMPNMVHAPSTDLLLT